MLSAESKGIFSIFATPFDAEDRLDLGAVGRMMAFYRNAGADGVTLLGVMGEAPKMSSSETRALVSEALAHAEGMTVLVGLGSMGIAQTCELSRELIGLGAHGVMVNAPPMLKTDADGVSHFRNIGRGLGDIPFVLQDFPLATGTHLPVQTLEAIVRCCPNLAMLKLEDWPSWSKIEFLRARSHAGEIRRVSILGGFGGLYLPEDLLRGSDGAMTGFSFPEMLRGVLEAKLHGDIRRMYDIFDAFLPIVRAELSLSSGLAVRKYILHRRGVLATPKVRFPGAQLSKEDENMVNILLDRLVARCDELSFPIELRPQDVSRKHAAAAREFGEQAWKKASAPNRENS